MSNVHPMVEHATALLENRFFNKIRNELEKKFYAEWLATKTLKEREDIHIAKSALEALMDYIEYEANRVIIDNNNKDHN